jgi:predicted RNA-binding Zn ribbon-like protein
LEGSTISQTSKIAKRRPPRFDLCGGALCLDFVNTLDDRPSSEPTELLKTYIDLARFAEDGGALAEDQVNKLFERSLQSPEPAERALAAAIELREAMHTVFLAMVKKKPVPQAALNVVNQYVQGAAQHMTLVPGRERLEWRFDSSLTDFATPLWPIARSAAELLASDQVDYVRACASKTCEWLFLDESKNHRRRWCDMTQCGNRAKVSRFYTRTKKANAQ